MELSAEEAWSRILEDARLKVPEQTFRTWLSPTHAIALTENTLIIGAPSRFAVEWIEDKYGPILEGLTRQLLGAGFALAFEARPEAGGDPVIPSLTETQPEEPATESAEPAVSATRGSVIGKLNPRYTLDRFVVGSNNELSVAACRAVAEAPGRAYNPLFIYGGVGLGKTHLMHAIGNAVMEQNAGCRVAYLPTEQFTNELIAAIQSRRTTAFHNRYRRIDVLLVDDAQFLAGKERTQEEFFHTFNALYEAQKQIVLASDRPPKEIPDLQKRLVSRFEWGLVTDIRPPDFETRLAILQMKATQDGLSIEPEVLALIAERCQSSVRELEGAVLKLLAYSSLARREITLDLATQVLAGTLGSIRDISPDQIESTVADAFQVSVDDLKSKKRHRQVTVPRQIAMYLEKQLLDLPLTGIGRRFGGRDHSTVIHSIQKVESMLETDLDFRHQVDRLRARLR